MATRPLSRLLLFATAGALFGRAISIIPSPEVHDVFWVANLSSPWLLLPFLAGFGQRSYRWGAITGVAADVSCVLGFYAGFLSLDPLRYGLQASAPLLQVAFASLGNWLVFIAPWVGAAVTAGLLYGLLGCWWGRTRSILPAAMVATPFILEPIAWRLREGFFPRPAMLWVVEAMLGVLTLLEMARVSRRPS